MPARAEETRSGPRESAEHFSGERRRSGRREPRRKRRGEGSGACGDEVEEARAAQSCIVNRRKSCAWRGRREPKRGAAAGASPRPTERIAGKGRGRTEADRLGPSGKRAARQGCRALRRTRERRVRDAAPYGGRESGASGMPAPYGGRESGASGMPSPYGDERAAHQGCRALRRTRKAVRRGCRALRRTRKRCAGDAAPLRGDERAAHQGSVALRGTRERRIRDAVALRGTRERRIRDAVALRGTRERRIRDAAPYGGRENSAPGDRAQRKMRGAMG